MTEEPTEPHILPRHLRKFLRQLPEMPGVTRFSLGQGFIATRSDALRVVAAIDELHTEALRQWRANQKAATLARHEVRDKLARGNS